MKSVLSLSDGNAVPGRGFSVNNIMLESHGYSIDSDTIAALKDSIRKEGGVDKFPITRKLLNYSFKSYAKYQEYLERKKETASAAAEARKQELEGIRNEIEKCELQGKAADDRSWCCTRILEENRKAAKTAQTKIELGLGQKRQPEERLEKLKSKKAKMSS